MTNILLAGVLALIAYVAWKQARRTEVDPQLEHKTRVIGEKEKEIENLRSEKDKLEGNGKQLFSRFKDLEADSKAMQYERDELKKRVTEYDAAAVVRERELDERLHKLHRAEKSLEDERLRIRREDEERQQSALEERDRMWSEHERTVISLLTDLCRQPQHQFTLFENTNLPEEFDGSFKPDALIEFLGQYIIFDAKVTRSQDIQTYIKDQVKKTAKKAKSCGYIYPSIFLVIPTDAIGDLKDLVYYEDGFTFYVVSSEALAPILASLKKITSYELAEQFDPQERENIVDLITKLDYHINERNTFDVLMARRGTEVLKDAEQLYPELTKEVALKKKRVRLPNFKTSDIRQLITSIEARKEAVDDLTAPKASIDL